MPQMTGGEALAKQLTREGVEVIFGLPGIQLYGIMAALRGEPGIRFIVTRHEQATAYMADGYARAGGGFGTALVVPGPGLLGASAAMSTAYSTSSPVLMLSGQIDRAEIGKNSGMFHEVNDQLDVIKPLTKWRRRVLEVDDIPAAVREAVHQLKTGRPRPVEVEFAWETLEEYGDAELVEPANPVRSAAPAADVAKAVDMLLAANNPVIYAGGGVNIGGAHEELAAVAKFLQAGVVQSAEGRGAVSDHNPLSLSAGMYPGNPVLDYLKAADLVLAVGTRLVRSGVEEGQQIIQIDIDPDEIGRSYGNTFGLVGDVAATLRALLEGLKSGGPPRASRTEQFQQMRAQRDADRDRTQPQGGIVASLRAGAPEDTIHVTGMTQIGYYSRIFWPVYHPRTYLTSGYSGNLGYAYPVGLGAKVARPDRPVLVSSGDGGFLYNAQEIATAVQHKINVVAVVFNDSAYGNVSRDLDMDWGGTFGAELHNPDFVRMAEAYGAVGLRVNEPEKVGDAVADAFQLDRPVVIEVPVGRMPRPSFFPRPPRQAPARS